MNVSLFQAASALQANSRWQELIAENLAASSIPGFKKQELSFAAIQAGTMPVPGGPQQKFLLPHSAAGTNFTQGQLRFTDSKTDLAIEGPGFFEVVLPNGTTAYTRDGEFRISPQGQLLTKDGYEVLGEGGPVLLDPNNHGPLTISATGQITQGGEPRGRFRISEFNDPRLLTPISAGYFLANHPSLDATDVAAPTLRQGYLEAANTSSVTEMASLLMALRLFEANQRVIQTNDERMGRAISELGNLNH
jgi:flagellar basal body rod protein FlgG